MPSFVFESSSFYCTTGVNFLFLTSPIYMLTSVYEKVEYPPTSEILADIEALNREIDKNLAELKALLNDGKEEESE